MNRKQKFFKINIDKFLEIVNPLAANDEHTRSGNLTFYQSWTPRMTLKSSPTHAPGISLISTDPLSSKVANFIKSGWQLKGSIDKSWLMVYIEEHTIQCSNIYGE